MLDVLTIIHNFADTYTAAAIRKCCKKLSSLKVFPKKFVYRRSICYKVGNKFHREDGPAVIFAGTELWYKHGKLHREGGPAVIKRDKYSLLNFVPVYANGLPIIRNSNGLMWWYIRGRLHREDGPAVICRNGDHYWYHRGVMHREEGPAAIYANGSEEWYINGALHRDDGPAATLHEGSAIKYIWYNRGVIHRDYGAAVITYTRKRYYRIYYNRGIRINRIQFIFMSIFTYIIGKLLCCSNKA